MPMPGQMMDAPPALPPDVTGAMGDNPISQVGSMMGDRMKQQQGGPGGDQQGANPQGALQAMLEPVEKVLRQMVRMNDKMQPFVERALALLKTGMGEALQTPAGGGQTGQKDQSSGMTAKAPEGEASRSFPG